MDIIMQEVKQCDDIATNHFYKAYSTNLPITDKHKHEKAYNALVARIEALCWAKKQLEEYPPLYKRLLSKAQDWFVDVWEELKYMNLHYLDFVPFLNMLLALFADTDEDKWCFLKIYNGLWIAGLVTTLLIL